MHTASALCKQVGQETELEIATFYLGELLLGIPISQIEEIGRFRELTPVPGAPPAVRGVMSLRGEVVTVLDLRVVLGLGTSECGNRTRNVIVRDGGERIGLLVDRMADVVRASRSALLAPPANMCGDGEMFASVYRLENELLVILKVAAATAICESAC